MTTSGEQRSEPLFEGETDGNQRIKRRAVVALGLGIPILVLLLIGFMAGWLASRHLIVKDDAAPSGLPLRGDASDDVRAEIRAVLRDFQDGYTQRNVDDATSFVQRLFSPGDESLVMGTEPGEWIFGEARIARFVANDWARWGDVRIDVEPAMISSKGDVAWLATSGTVTFSDSINPIRFTGVLVRREERWVFRQMQFQWDRRGPSFWELLRPQTLLRLRWH